MRLSRAVNVVGGIGFPHEEQGGTDGVPFLKVSDLEAKRTAEPITAAENFVPEERLKALRANVVPAGSVLMPKIGAAMQGRHRRVVLGVPAAFDNNVLALVPRSVESRFLAYWLSQLDLTPVTNPGAVASLDMSAFRALNMPSMAMDRQVATADFLDRECARVAEVQRQMGIAADLNEAWLSSRLRELLDVDRGEARFGLYATLHRGYDLPSDARGDGDVVVIGSGGPTGTHHSPAVGAPAVVTGRYGSIGVVTWSDEPCWPLNTTLFVSDFRGSSPRFIYWALRALPLRRESAKAAVPGLHRADVHRLRLGRFDLVEQTSIATRLDDLAAGLRPLTDERARFLDALQEYRDALIAEAVTGKLDISSMSEARMEESLVAVREGETPEVLAS